MNSSKDITALEAKNQAQRIAFGPIYFQAVMSLKRLGILELIAKNKKGITIYEIHKKTGVSIYGIKVLLEAAESINVVNYLTPNEVELTKIGFFLNSDRMTEVNLDFVQDVCYDGVKYLQESIENTKPEGLKVLGDWDTVYIGLSKLPEKIKKSWFDFDHYYSDDAFPAALKIVFDNKPKRIFDIGGNTGKWTTACCKYNDEVKITILDLPGQLAIAKNNIIKAGIQDRVDFFPIDMLDSTSVIPKGANTVWMSQFLDCFSSEEIVSILKKVYDAATDETDIYILETFIDNQEYEAAKYCLTGTSLYFTAIANGNSKMYSLTDMEQFVREANLKVIERHPLIGNSYHTIIKCRKNS